MIRRVFAIVSFLMFALASVSFAFVLLTKEDAFKEVFFSGAEIEKETGVDGRNSRANQRAIGRQPDIYSGRL